MYGRRNSLAHSQIMEGRTPDELALVTLNLDAEARATPIIYLKDSTVFRWYDKVRGAMGALRDAVSASGYGSDLTSGLEAASVPPPVRRELERLAALPPSAQPTRRTRRAPAPKRGD